MGFDHEEDIDPPVDDTPTQKPEAAESRAVEVLRFMTNDKQYRGTTITVLSPGLEALLLFALGSDPPSTHGRISTKQRFYSPFVPLIHHWDELEDLATPENHGSTTRLLQEKLQERRARSTRTHPSRQSDYGPQTSKIGLDDEVVRGNSGRRRASTIREGSPIARHDSDAQGAHGAGAARHLALSAGEFGSEM